MLKKKLFQNVRLFDEVSLDVLRIDINRLILYSRVKSLILVYLSVEKPCLRKKEPFNVTFPILHSVSVNLKYSSTRRRKF